MSNFTIKLLSGALIFASIFILSEATSAQSAESALSDSLELEQVVVTASKIEQTRRETTKPVQIIDWVQLENNAGRNLSQILNQQSGIRVNDSFGSPSNGRILYMQGAAATNTLILIDGMPISDPSGTGGLFDLRLLPTDNIQRIEIIKGSQSTLYGTDAIAGVINIITRKGADDAINGSGRLSYGSFRTFEGDAALNGRLDDKLRYSINYTRESSEGISAAKNPGTPGAYDRDGYALDAVSARFDVMPTSAITFTPSIRYSDNSGDYDGGAFVDANNQYSLLMINPAVQGRYESETVHLNADYSYTRTERAFENRFGRNEFEGRFHNADLYGDVALNDYLKLLAGFNFQDFTIPGASEQQSRHASITSPYATLYLKNIGGFSTELGYRLNRHSEYGSNSTFSVAPSYRLSDQVKLFASVTSGFKAPTLDELFGPFGANPDLDPQTSLYSNVGAEIYLLEQSLKVSSHYFIREIDNLIIYADNRFINRDRQNDRGVEFSADWLVRKGFTVGAWYNYLDGELTIEEEGGDTIEDNLIRRPAHAVGFHAGFEAIDHLTIRLNGEYNGERSDLYFNPENGFAAEVVSLDPYLLLNLYSEYSLFEGQFSLFADVKNLLNSDFTEVYGYNTIGTAVQAGVTVNF